MQTIVTHKDGTVTTSVVDTTGINLAISSTVRVCKYVRSFANAHYDGWTFVDFTINNAHYILANDEYATAVTTSRYAQALYINKFHQDGIELITSIIV